MPNYSRWQENEETNIDAILNKMLSYEDFITPYKDPLTNDNLEFNVSKQYEENLSVNFNNMDITYNVVHYRYERPRIGEEENTMRSTRINSIAGKILVYSDGNNTQYIIDKAANPSTLTLLRKLNNYSGQKEIEAHPVKVNEDFFIWMMNKVLNEQSESLHDTEHLKINKIIGFKGSTDDKLAEVKGSGNRIMNVLSTLAFLFETEGVSHINPRIEYKNHMIEFMLQAKGNVSFDIETYTGDYIFEPIDDRLPKVLLLTYLEVLPTILTCYGNDIESEEWSKEIKVDFLNGIGTQIQRKIDEKIRKIRN